MAIIVPYADPNAHGSLHDAYTFRRQFATVMLMKKPYSKPTNTPSQQIQRAVFKNACDSYNLLTDKTKEFYRLRARMILRNGRTLYIQHHLIGKLPSIVPKFEAQSIVNMVIQSVAGLGHNNIQFSLYGQNGGDPPAARYGWITDDDNEYTENLGVTAISIWRLKIENLTGELQKIPFYYSIAVTRVRSPDIQSTWDMRLPKIHLAPGEVVYLYLSSDISLYWDQGLTELAGTSKIKQIGARGGRSYKPKY